MESHYLRYVIAGRLQRDFILPLEGKPALDVPGGSALYAAVGVLIWDKDIGLISRVGEDYPQEWLDEFTERGLDVQGVRILPQALDLRRVICSADESEGVSNPMRWFAQRGIPIPKALLGYTPSTEGHNHHEEPTPLTLRLNDIPQSYLEATAAHLAPMDYLSHSLLPSALRKGNITTITLDPGSAYMHPALWERIPSLIRDLTAFLVAEDDLRRLFQGRSTDLWEMAEGIAAYGCDFVVVKRGEVGQYLYDRVSQKRWTIPAYPARVVDPTGAGDAFCGGFLAGYRQTYDPLEAVLFGNISASLVIEGSGPFYALDALPGLARARLDVLRDAVSVL
ncbi:carbohydrate kinase family protein [Thermanaerothrix sp. 4228-RoL]|jgi:sugar/nucleoside kinase (ribokinase family)|uniref:Carbohydrate kinase family protein n=1 Tax=Thermanaerothrix solaris TaxID=3058434 RepID=A0ABU3NKH7_9CHLR|nr:carbohydrate kinase family protein [Thermanaerothrix sp. 4228-RoL]MDT8897324.1 carbohydrate kinase family protein [Thermanaerothrix sp. 4228-RoL]